MLHNWPTFVEESFSTSSTSAYSRMKLRISKSHPSPPPPLKKKKKKKKESFLLQDRGTFSHTFAACGALHFEEYRRDGRAASGPVVWGVEVQLGAQLPVRPRAGEGIPGRGLETWRRRARQWRSDGKDGRGR